MLSNTDVMPSPVVRQPRDRESKRKTATCCILQKKKSAGMRLFGRKQGVLAPLQFFVFRFYLSGNQYLNTGDGYQLATISVIAKTSILLVIMITGAIWEKVVFGQYLLAPAFFWEDVVSFFVIFLHIAYVLALWINLFRATTYVVSSLHMLHIL